MGFGYFQETINRIVYLTKDTDTFEPIIVTILHGSMHLENYCLLFVSTLNNKDNANDLMKCISDLLLNYSGYRYSCICYSNN